MSWSTDTAMLSGLFDERVEAVTPDQIEGCFAFNAKCKVLVEKFKRLNDENVSEAEQKHIHYEINTYILLLLSGVFSEMFYLINDKDISFPNNTTFEDIFNYVFFQQDYDNVREKVNALLELTGEPPIDTAGSNPEPMWALLLDRYKAEMHTVSAHQTQLEAVNSLRKLEKLPGEMLWRMASKNKEIQTKANELGEAFDAGSFAFAKLP